MKTRSLVALTSMGALGLITIRAQIINFETLPDGSRPIEGMEISNQFAASFGVSFRLETGYFPRIAKRDSQNFVAFYGPPNSSLINHPATNQNVGDFFLTGYAGRTGNPSPLLISYARPVAAASGAIIDIDFHDAWQIVARDSRTNGIATNLLTRASLNTGDGHATWWSFSRASADICSIRISYAGTGSPVGWAFDNFSPYLPVAPANLGIEMTKQAAQIGVGGTFGCAYRVDYADSPVSTNWKCLANVVLTNAPQQFLTDPTSSNSITRFYRAVVPSDMVWIQPGTFRMGSPTNEVDRAPDEGPQMTVTISRGFWMSKYQTTQTNFLTVITNRTGYYGDPSLPATSLTWNDATNYCAQLTLQARAAGRITADWVYRLPTEAEWEYACRAGTSTRFSYGDDAGYVSLGQYAWYHDNGGYQTHPVGLKQPNPWGLYDMAGNVWEWCQDWYGAYPGGSVIDPQGPSAGARHVLRGGGYYSYGQYCRSAARYYPNPLTWTFAFGFRVVLAPL